MSGDCSTSGAHEENSEVSSSSVIIISIQSGAGLIVRATVEYTHGISIRK